MTHQSDRIANRELFEAIEKRLLIERLDRLRKLIDLNGPATVIAMCIPGVVAAAASVYGDAVFLRFGQVVVHQERLNLGFCPFCRPGTPNRISEAKTPHGESWGMCDACLASVNTVDIEDDASVEAEADDDA